MILIKSHYSHAIVTGGSSGIGRALAKELTLSGSNLSLIARNSLKLEQVKSELDAIKIRKDQQILTYTADVSNRQQVEQVLEQAINNISPPDLLINSAGIVYPDYFQNLPIEVFEQTMAVNYFGSLYCIKAVLPAMQQQGKGHIVLISSGAGLMGIYGYTAYSPTKFAIRGLAESLRPELKMLGINLSIVYPSDTDTPQLAQENITKPPETKAITGQVKIWSPESVAIEILKGIEKNLFIITPGFAMSFLAKFHSLLGTPINKYFDSIISKASGKTNK
jgi:3-dehydrosphinganine reductase